MNLDFTSQPFSKSTLPLAWSQHMQQCQVGWNIPFSLFCFMLLIQVNSEWKIVSTVGSEDLNQRPFIHELSALTTRPRLLSYIKIFFTYLILLVFLHADYVKNINPNIKIRKQHICAGIAKKGVCHVRNLILSPCLIPLLSVFLTSYL
jgi:hypothetical protein